MKKLLNVLELISQDAPAWAALVAALTQALDSLPKNPTPDQIIEAIKETASDAEVQVEFKTCIQAVLDDKNVKLCALPSYGWDGGSPVNSDTFNLKSLSGASIGGGATAAVCKIAPFSNFPGIAIHHAVSDEVFVVCVYS